MKRAHNDWGIKLSAQVMNQYYYIETRGKRQMSNEEKRAKVHQILDLVMDINGLEARSPNGNPGPTVFFEFEGHVGNIVVRIYNDGWNRINECDLWLEHTFRHNCYQNLEEIEQELKEWIKEHESHE